MQFVQDVIFRIRGQVCNIIIRRVVLYIEATILHLIM